MPRGAKVNRNRFVAIFFLSGLAGLAYQVVWAKSFAAAIGHEYPAMLAVVTAFMCGMAAGNLVLARVREISPRCYGWLEIGIGIWAIALTLLTPTVESIVFKLLGPAPSPFYHWFIVFAVVLFVLFPATAAMGATLPAAEHFLSATIQRPTTALLYSANTAGATLGALLAAFWIMPMLGLRLSSFALAGVNLLCGIAALMLAAETTASTYSSVSSANAAPRRLASLLFFTGALGIGFEVAIVRGLSQILENTVYTFAVVLATYLAGTALGAYLYHRAPNARAFLGRKRPFLALAVTCLIAAIALRWMPSTYLGLRSWLGDSLFAVALAETLVAVSLLLVPCICMGATWSWLAEASLQFRPNLGWAVAINTLGAALGPVVWGLVLIPFAGLKGALAAVAVAYAGIALAGRTRVAVIMFIVVAAAIPFVTSNRDLIDTASGRIISFKEGVMGSVAVIESSDGARVLKFNNRFQMGGTAARIAEQRQADIPLLLLHKPRRVLFIGLGTGISFATAAHHPDLIADGVELVPEIAEAMPLFNDTRLQSTNLITHIADGRRFIRATTNRYDVIIADLFHPAQDGAGFLYTREHFQAIRDRLDGIFCQWLPLHQLDLDTLNIIIRTFETVFPDAQYWLLRFNIDTPVIGLIGGAGPSRPLVESRMLNHPGLPEHLRTVGLTDSVRLFGCYIGKSKFRPSGEINTDANPTVIFRAPAITFQRADQPGERLLAFIEAAESAGTPPPWNGANFAWTHPRETNFPSEIPRFIRARNIYLKGLLHETRGEQKAALAAFIESAKTSSHFTAGYAQALTLAATLAKSNPQSARAILEALIAAQPERPVARELLERLESRN